MSLAKGNVRQRIQKALAAELQKLESEAEEYAKKQLSLPLEDPSTQGELDLGSEYEAEDKISYERQPQRVPEFDFVNSGFGFKFDVIEKMEGKVIIGIHLDFEVAVDATAENYGAIKAFVSYLDGNKDRFVEALQNLIDPYYEAIRASSINLQKQERERMQQKVSDAEAAGKDPLAAGAYYRQDLNEETLRHIVREALKRKLLKEMNSSFLVASPEEEAEMARSIEDQMQKDYIDSEYGEGAYDASQLVDTDVSYVEPQSPLEEPLSHPAEIDSYWKEGTLRADEVSKFAPKLSQLSNQIQSHSETGEFLVDGKPLSEIDPDLNRFAKWSSERTLISPLGGAQHGTREDDLPRISSTFGPRFNPLNPDVGRKKLHRALDIGGAAAGTKFLAPATGIVVAAGADAYPGEKKGKGNYLIIKTQEPTTGKWLFHKFFHLNKEPNFKKGEAITQGQQLGEVGNTGSSTGAHLHWQVHRNSRGGARVDPAALMAQAGNIGWEKYAYKPSKTAANESQLRYAIQEALKRKLSPLKEAEEKSSRPFIKLFWFSASQNQSET